MAKYIVRRTSDWLGDDKPVPDAERCEIHLCFALSGMAAKSYRDRMRQRMDVEWEDEDGSFGGFMKEAEDAWLCDIPDLKAFVLVHGRIILSEPDNKEGYWNVEIYDGYRE